MDSAFSALFLYARPCCTSALTGSITSLVSAVAFSALNSRMFEMLLKSLFLATLFRARPTFLGA